jgi:integrase
MASSKTKEIKSEIQVKNLKPRADRYEVAQYKSHARLVVFPSGAMSWVFRYRADGRTRKMTIDAGPTDLKRARDLAAEAYNAVKAGRDPGEEKKEKKLAASTLTIDGLIERYAKDHLGKVVDPEAAVSYRLRSGDEVERILRKELAPYLKRRAGSLSETEAADLIDGITERGKRVMSNRTLVACKSLYKFAMKPKVGAAGSNPFAAIELLDEKSRERVLTNEELKAVWNAAGKLGGPCGEVVRLLILSGQRLGEIANLRWSEINLNERQILLPGARTKNERSHIVALSDPAIEILERAKDNKIHSAENLIFTLNGNRLNGWPRLRARLHAAVEEELGRKPEGWTIHDIRRSVATHMAEDLKIAPHVIDKILNHSTGAISGVALTYNRGELLDERRAALDAWGRYVDRLIKGEQPGVVVKLRA